MKFGRVPLDDAEGALLSHSLPLKSGAPKLKKGHRLSADDVAALRSAGHGDVMAAQLEPGDVREDEAAARVGEAMAGPGVRPARPFTGRCNLHAESAGLAVIDRARIDRFNRIDESVTIATLAPYEVVEDNQLIATVKIIPLAVTQEVLGRCAEVAAADGPLIRIAPFAAQPVGLLLTELPGTKQSVLDKTVKTLSGRVTALGSHVKKEVRCGHDEESVAAAIADLVSAGCSPIVVFGASAIIDRRDVVPLGVERTGGQVDRLGMPVDPGNLILLAHHGATVILGVPGSARSPRFNGFDYVLQRLLADVPVTGDEIAGMGVGGLLKEVPGRPQPREQPPAPAPAVARPGPRIAALVLAAGQSRRMGKTNKLLAEIDGEPMVTHVVDTVLASQARPVVVVTGHEADRVRAALAGRDVEFVVNPDYADGLSTSLARGLAALPDDIDGVLACLGDMPRVKPQHLDRLIAAFRPAENRSICVPTYNGKRGNPVLWAASYFADMRKVTGDVGARHLIGENDDQVCEVSFEDDGIFIDVDTPKTLKALKALTG